MYSKLWAYFPCFRAISSYHTMNYIFEIRDAWLWYILFLRNRCVVFRSLQAREIAWTLSQTDEFVLILQFSFSSYRGIAKSYGDTERSRHRLFGNNAKLITALSISTRLHRRTFITFINDVGDVTIMDM